MSKMAVVTGGTKGIGKAIINKLASEKFDIVTCARNADELQALSKSVQDSYKVKVFVFPADLSDREQVHSFGHFIKNLQQPLDVLVNNVGSYVSGKVTEEKEGSLEGMMAVNLYSAYYMTREIVDLMRARKRGHIFNIGSIASTGAFSNGGAYSISKFALHGFSKILRAELMHDNIRVTVILPGMTRTPSWDGVDLPQERFIKPEDLAASIFSAYSLSHRTVVEEITVQPQLGGI
jgi:short-subunit dehydrogenase